MSTTVGMGPYREPAPLPCERLVPPPTRARRVAFGLAGAFAAFVVVGLVSIFTQGRLL